MYDRNTPAGGFRSLNALNTLRCRLADIIEREGENVLCSYDDCIPPRHARSKLRTHGSDELLDVFAVLARVVGHRDDLRS